MPRAPRGDTEYFSGTFCGGSRISWIEGSEDEHSPSALRHSEETAVDNPPRQAIPEVGHLPKHDSEVPTAIRGEQSGYVLQEYPSRSKAGSDPRELVEEARRVSFEARSLAGDGEIGAWKSSAEKIDIWGFCSNFPDVLENWNSGEVVSEDASSESVLLTEEAVSKPSPSESEIHSSAPLKVEPTCIISRSTCSFRQA